MSNRLLSFTISLVLITFAMLYGAAVFYHSYASAPAHSRFR